jgi:hypothetical protein
LVPTEIVIHEDEAGEEKGWNEGGLLEVEGKEGAVNDANPSKDLCIV